jgi:hypothetical protein
VPDAIDQSTELVLRLGYCGCFHKARIARSLHRRQERAAWASRESGRSSHFLRERERRPRKCEDFVVGENAVPPARRPGPHKTPFSEGAPLSSLPQRRSGQRPTGGPLSPFAVPSIQAGPSRHPSW